MTLNRCLIESLWFQLISIDPYIVDKLNATFVEAEIESVIKLFNGVVVSESAWFHHQIGARYYTVSWLGAYLKSNGNNFLPENERNLNSAFKNWNLQIQHIANYFLLDCQSKKLSIPINGLTVLDSRLEKLISFLGEKDLIYRLSIQLFVQKYFPKSTNFDLIYYSNHNNATFLEIKETKRPYIEVTRTQFESLKQIIAFKIDIYLFVKCLDNWYFENFSRIRVKSAKNPQKLEILLVDMKKIHSIRDFNFCLPSAFL